jgi:hypothetical protein
MGLDGLVRCGPLTTQNQESACRREGSALVSFSRSLRVAAVIFVLLLTSAVSAQKFAIAPRFDYAGPFSEGLADVRVGGKIAFIDKAGKIKFSLPEHITVAYPFSSGLARVLSKSGRYGYIDKSGKIVIDLKFGLAQDFSDGVAVVAFDIHPPHSGKMQYGVIDKSGRFVINPYVGVIFDSREGYLSTNFGRIGDPTVGLIDRHGRIIINGGYEYIHRPSEGLAASLTPNNGWGFIDLTGAWVVSPRFDYLEALSEGLATFANCKGAVFKPYDYRRNPECRLGYVDRGGKLVIRAQFTTASPFSGGRAVVSFQPYAENSSVFETEDRKFGYIDRDGRLIVDPVYSEARPFKEGLAAVRLKVAEKKFQWGYLDFAGVPATKFEFDDASDISEGLAAVRVRSGKWGYLGF